MLNILYLFDMKSWANISSICLAFNVGKGIIELNN